MANQNQRNDNQGIARTLFGVAAGAAVAYGAYKLFSGSAGPSENQPHTSSRQGLNVRPFPIMSQHEFPRDSKIVLVETQDECRRALELLELRSSEFPVLGLDCEWVSGFQGNREKVALLQLASHEGLCVLIRLSELNTIPAALRKILADGDILKVGVGITRDAQYLSQDYRLSISSTLELGFMALQANCEGIKRSLDFLSEKYLGHLLEKRYEIRCSDWEAYGLSDEQIEYAAMDALVAIELFKVFAEKMEPSSVTNPYRLQKVMVALSQYLGKSDR